jgi:hypothetical protein
MGKRTFLCAFACISLLAGCARGGDGDGSEAELPDDTGESSGVLGIASPRDAARRGLTNQLPPALIETCRELAHKSAMQGVSRPVHCPPLVPKGEQRIELAGGVDRYRDLARGYVVAVWKLHARTAAANGAHWTFSGGEHAAVRVYSHHPHMPAIRPLRTHNTRLAGTSAMLFYMPHRGAGFYAGHVGVEWRTNASTFHLTMHGHVNGGPCQSDG